MQAITTIGLDIAKSVFQVHGVDAEGQVVIRRQLKRRYVLAFFERLPPCLVGIEACASSHHWSRQLQALGHTVKLMPPSYVKPYVKRHKNDATDAEAICEAVSRPNMRFVATKTPEQQSCLILHRTRHLLIRQQTSVINAIRAHLAEFGIVAPVGRNGVEQLLGVVADASDKRLPEVARACVAAVGVQLRVLKAQILEFDRMISAWHRSFIPRNPLIEVLDVAFGLVILADFSARMFISRHRVRDLAHPVTWADLAAIISFLAPLIGEPAGFLRILRTLRFLRSYQLLSRLRQDFQYFRVHEDVIIATTNLAVFMFVMTGFVYETQHARNPEIGNYADALYYTVTALTTTGFGDITLPGTLGRLIAVVIMISGVTLFFGAECRSGDTSA